MKLLTLILALLFCFVAFASEGEPSGFDKFITKGAVYAALVVMVVEYLIAQSVLKANSTIDVILGVIKFIFRIKDEK